MKTTEHVEQLEQLEFLGDDVKVHESILEKLKQVQQYLSEHNNQHFELHELIEMAVKETYAEELGEVEFKKNCSFTEEEVKEVTAMKSNVLLEYCHCLRGDEERTGDIVGSLISYNLDIHFYKLKQPDKLLVAVDYYGKLYQAFTINSDDLVDVASIYFQKFPNKWHTDIFLGL